MSVTFCITTFGLCLFGGAGKRYYTHFMDEAAADMDDSCQDDGRGNSWRIFNKKGGAQDNLDGPRCLSWQIWWRFILVIMFILTVASFLQYSCTHLLSRPSSSLQTREAKPQAGIGRPTAILHIGPRKTMTTSIQYILSQNETQYLLKKDSFVYLGKGHDFQYDNEIVAPFMKACFGTKQQCQNYTAVWPQFVKELRERRDRNENIIISEEAFPHIMLRNEGFKLLQDSFQGWNVKILAIYRRYYDWILSEYNQENKNKTTATMPFVKWYKKQMHGKRSRAFMPLDQSLMNRWLPYFPTICIFNMHSCKGDLMPCFLCEMIPEAAELCEKSKMLPAVPADHRQQSDTLIDAKIVAQAALKQNLLSGKGEDEVAAAVHGIMAGNNTMRSGVILTVPLQCLSVHDQQKVLRRSLKIEREMVPEFHLLEGKSSLLSDFKKATHKNKFCNVDVEKLLQDDVWLAFFRELNT